jgi:hypothetical protein
VSGFYGDKGLVVLQQENLTQEHAGYEGLSTKIDDIELSRVLGIYDSMLKLYIKRMTPYQWQGIEPVRVAVIL